MTKREGRISAFEMLFESDFRKDEAPQEIYDKAIDIREAKTNNFSRELFEKCTSHVDEIDKAVEECADNWKLSRMNCVTRAVLRMAACELLYSDVPPRVAINEAVEISKLYHDERGTSFVNGVLNRLARNIGRITDDE